MPNVTFNIAKGRVVELYNRVQSNDPANSALIVVILRLAGLESDAVLQDRATLASVLTAGTTREATNTNYARKVITDTSLVAINPDNVSDMILLDTPDITWNTSAPHPLAGDTWAKLLFCWDADTTTGTDTNIIPMTMHDFSAIPDGTPIIAQISNFFRAQ